MSERREKWAREKVYESHDVFRDILYDAERGKCSWDEALQQMVVEFGGKMPEQPDDYVCGSCGSENVVREDGVDERYPDDWSLDCEDCGNWEQVGNNRPYSFKVVSD